MKNHWKISRRILLISRILFLGVLALVLYQFGYEFTVMRHAIERLSPDEIERLLVYDSFSRAGTARIVTDKLKIGAFLDSFRNGNYYRPNHDRSEGFKQCVIIEPQQFEIQAYQKEGDEEAIIAHLSKRYRNLGGIRCPDPAAWKSL